MPHKYIFSFVSHSTKISIAELKDFPLTSFGYKNKLFMTMEFLDYHTEVYTYNPFGRREIGGKELNGKNLLRILV
jgi:hypothetical protein